MNKAGIPGTYAMLGGPTAWKNLGYPMESGEKK
jgi:rhodanese-related sulfurtransferase